MIYPESITCQFGCNLTSIDIDIFQSEMIMENLELYIEILSIIILICYTHFFIISFIIHFLSLFIVSFILFDIFSNFILIINIHICKKVLNQRIFYFYFVNLALSDQKCLLRTSNSW